MREHGSLSLPEMADVAHLSPYYFARTFRRVTGIPPGEFMTALRLEQAKRLLLTTSLGVGEICFEVGYSSVGSFTSRFTQLVGLSPTRLRRLPERLEAVQERVVELSLSGTGPATGRTAAGIRGRIEVPDLGRAPGRPLIFAGLFTSAIPQRGPAAGVMLTAPGDFTIHRTPDGLYNLMAAAVPLSPDPRSLLLPGEGLLVGRADHQILARGGSAPGRAVVPLRPLRMTDPPILTPLAMLLVDRLDRTSPGPDNRAR
ncbi:MAG: helix-turn-helix transcriptional regulator [Rubrobacteraceae bacterium]